MSQNRPWDILPDWRIVGMNHYSKNGEKWLFVAMVKDDICIKEEGPDDEYLWNRLWHKAHEIQPSSVHHP